LTGHRSPDNGLKVAAGSAARKESIMQVNQQAIESLKNAFLTLSGMIDATESEDTRKDLYIVRDNLYDAVVFLGLDVNDF
jgi:hypothetical protein